VPGRRPELRPLKRGVLPALLTWLLLAGPAAAQSADDSGARVSASTELALTQLADEWIPQAGGAITLRVAPWLQVGGVGRVGLEHLSLREQPGVQIRFGYGGVRVGVRPAAARWPGFTVSLLGGAGNVDVRELTTAGVVDSENGGVIEPGVSLERALGSRVRAGASASWRFAFEFDAVVGIDSNELGGPAIGVGLTIGPF
jgi:hypothetical protein